MKIVHIVLGKANPNRMNGVSKVAHNLATVQKKMGHDVEILGLTNTPETDKIERNYNIRFYRRKKFLLDKNLENYIKEIDLDNSVVHIHGGFIIDFYLIAKQLTIRHIKYIFTSHGTYNKKALQKRFYVKKIFFAIFDSYILKHAWKVQFLGESEYQYIDNLISDINKVLIPNGQNMDELNFDYSQISSTKRPVFGFVGRVDIHTKGLDFLFAGFSVYKRNGGKGILWIVGNGSDLEKLKSLSTANGLTNDIIFYGSKFGNEKLNLIANMDVFVHTSRFEGFPMAVLEAGGLGKPLLISEGTNFGTFVKNYQCGMVLENNSSDNISSLLKAFESLEQNEIALMGKNTLGMLEAEFNWEYISQKLLEENI
ncbi:MAG: glycosyltransferase [Bacteroidales bacterium]|nr:glycosyltransferase [Bacteroidales bacterium]